MRAVPFVVVALAGCTQGYDAFLGGRSTGSTTTSTGWGGAGTTTASTGGNPTTTGTNTGGAGAAADGGGGAAAGGDGGGGSKPVVCGDGIIDPGEQCDGGAGSPLCVDCAVVCDGPFEHLNPTTLHCYYASLTDGMHTSWQQGRGFCQQAWNGDLAVIGDETERAWIATVLPQDYDEDEWVGADDGATEGSFVWIDATPWAFPVGDPAWAGGEPTGSGTQNCVALDRTGHLLDKACNASLTHHMCERAPVGTLP